MKGADVFSGLSGPNIVTQDMVRSMADQPIIFAMANPVPEISYEAAKAAREDVIIATGRSDYPNQVNNVLGFPFIFRGALDVRARAINEEMKIAATRALAALAKEDVPDMVLRAYGVTHLHFGKDYIIPKPFDPRVLLFEASAVAQAAMESGVAQVKVDIEQYREQLARRLGRTQEVMFSVRQRAKTAPKRIVFSEGEHEKIIRASCQLTNLKIAHPVLLGRPAVIMKMAEELDLCKKVSAEIIEPAHSPRLDAYAEELYRLRQRRGVTRSEARELMANSNYFGAMMVHMGDADGFVAGVSQHYPDTIRPALQIIATRPDVHKVAGLYVIVTKTRHLSLCRHHRQHRAQRGRSGGDRPAFRGSGRKLRHPAARGDAVIFQLRQHTPSLNREGAPSHRNREAAESQAHGGRGDDGGYGAGSRTAGGIPLLKPAAEGQCSGLPQPRSRQHGL